MFEKSHLKVTGIRVVRTFFALEEVRTPKFVERDFWERWFSLPWRPFQYSKIVEVVTYQPAIYFFNNKTLLYHPAKEEALKRLIENGEIFRSN